MKGHFEICMFTNDDVDDNIKWQSNLMSTLWWHNMYVCLFVCGWVCVFVCVEGFFFLLFLIFNLFLFVICFNWFMKRLPLRKSFDNFKQNFVFCCCFLTDCNCVYQKRKSSSKTKNYTGWCMCCRANWRLICILFTWLLVG